MNGGWSLIWKDLMNHIKQTKRQENELDDIKLLFSQYKIVICVEHQVLSFCNWGDE